jgi:hypothetical protein
LGSSNGCVARTTATLSGRGARCHRDLAPAPKRMVRMYWLALRVPTMEKSGKEILR